MIPITILTGFLGSGKTTLLNHIIRSADGRKIAVVENEFGSAGIDTDLIERSTEEIIEVSNGCMCCTVRRDFMEAIDRLFQSGKEIDYIIIECSGMSDPLPIAQSFLMNSMEGRVRLDSIIAVVDAVNFQSNTVQSVDTALDQLEFADFIILNKSSEISGIHHQTIEEIIRRVNAFAPIIRTDYGAVDLDLLLDTTRIDESRNEFLRDRPSEHSHAETLSSYTYRWNGIFDLQILSDVFDGFSEIYRMKGFLHLDQDPSKRFLFQKAGARMNLEPYDEADPEMRNILVFIGESLNPFEINMRMETAKKR